MKIVVCVKHVPDTEAKIRADGDSIDESGLKWVMSPYDEYALEEGLRLRDAGKADEVIVVSAGSDAVQATLRQGLAMGADRAVLIKAEDGVAFGRGAALSRAKVLAAAAKELDAGLVLLGKYGVGTDESQTGPMLAEVLDWPHVGSISKLEVGDGRLTAERPVEGAVEVHESSLPAVLTCEKGLNEPRYPSLKGIMQAKKKPLETRTPGDLGVDPSTLTAGLVWESLEMPPGRSEGRLLDGSAEEAAQELARLLREEAKVI